MSPDNEGGDITMTILSTAVSLARLSQGQCITFKYILQWVYSKTCLKETKSATMNIFHFFLFSF